MAQSTLFERASESHYFPVAVVLALTSITCLTIGSIAHANIALNASQAIKNTMMIVGYGLGGGCTTLTILTLILTGKNYPSISEQDLKLCLLALYRRLTPRPFTYSIARFHLNDHDGEWIFKISRGTTRKFGFIPASNAAKKTTSSDGTYIPAEDLLKLGRDLNISPEALNKLNLVIEDSTEGDEHVVVLSGMDDLFN